ncbi:MAG: hypothetical protein HY835_05855 [Anaerolineae bacterium]|nr:hypothetical protein [Anaerolineae bacterium]
MNRSRPLIALLTLAILLTWAIPPAPSQAQNSDARQKAQSLLAQMTPEERVGQLFLVGFNGTNINASSQIYDLISTHHIGGVVLQRKNNNLTDQTDVLGDTYQLTAGLQDLEFQISRNAEGAPADSPAYIPLLIGIAQEGDLYPNDQLVSGVTQLPNLMSIGATWDTSLAGKVGEVMGKELSALGFNLYLGPSLDVLDVLYITGREDLGVRSFGGDPYWVGEMGKAYISGLHTGSQNRLAVIAKHFPGQGGSDRQPDTEIPTVRKNFEQLKQIELAPFFAVTNNANPVNAQVDGMLLSHIRYQGFQRNIRQSTLPLSFDRTALNDILSLEELIPWRESGGVLVSDNLGSTAIKRFFDPIGNRFDGRLVARDAFLAGNDLLFVDDFLSSGDPDPATTVARTVEFFAQKYREDAVFAQRVDQSVERILTLKYELYPEFDVLQVIPDSAGLSTVGVSSQVSFDVASNAVTLISPSAEDLVSVLPRSPQVGERIVFITDTMGGRQCSSCADAPAMRVDALQAEVLRLYGPQAGGQVSPTLLSSYSFFDLWGFVTKQEDLPPIENDLIRADWVVFGVMDSSSARAESQALRRLLSERPDLLRNKRVVVFAFNAPYYLDATDISKLTAYYGVFSKIAPFAEVATRILFQEITPKGALPVSVPGIGYDLIEAVRPHPAQIISLVLDLPETEVVLDLQGTPVPTPVPTFKVGDTIPLKTGVIIDQNRHPVPDGTPVRFLFTIGGEMGAAQTIEALTVGGVARASYRIERGGLLDISVTSDPAYNSNRLQLDITGNESAAVTAIVPTQQPTETATPTPTLTPTATATPTVEVESPKQPEVGDWFLALVVSIGFGALSLFLAVRMGMARWAWRWALCVALGGLSGYTYIALQMPGTATVLEWGITRGALLMSIMGALAGALAGWIWYELTERGFKVSGQE